MKASILLLFVPFVCSLKCHVKNTQRPVTECIAGIGEVCWSLQVTFGNNTNYMSDCTDGFTSQLKPPITVRKYFCNDKSNCNLDNRQSVIDPTVSSINCKCNERQWWKVSLMEIRSDSICKSDGSCTAGQPDPPHIAVCVNTHLTTANIDDNQYGCDMYNEVDQVPKNYVQRLCDDSDFCNGVV